MKNNTVIEIYVDDKNGQLEVRAIPKRMILIPLAGEISMAVKKVIAESGTQ